MSNSNKKNDLPGENDEGNFIQIGDLKLFNKDLRKIVQTSESISSQNELQSNKQFMKSLNEYAAEKSKEIIESTVSSSAIKQKPKITKKGNPAASKPVELKTPTNTQAAKKIAIAKKKSEKKIYVNPGGSNTPYYAKPVECDSSDYEKVHQNHYKQKISSENSLEKSPLFLKSSLEIAQKLIETKLEYTFQFQIDFYFGTTGILRQCAFNFIGDETFEDIYYLFKHKYCDSENFQLFYMNHDGKLMEIHNTMTLKQMLVTHGAYPKGIFDTKKEIAKVLCIPRCTMTEETIFEREIDLIMGVDHQLLCQHVCNLAENLLFHIAPDSKYADVAGKTVVYSNEETSRLYNTYETILELAQYCQRDLDIEQLFDDDRHSVISTNDLVTLLLNRNRSPYKTCTGVESMQIEMRTVLDMLRRSRHQTIESLEHVEAVLKRNVNQFIMQPA